MEDFHYRDHLKTSLTDLEKKQVKLDFIEYAAMKSLDVDKLTIDKKLVVDFVWYLGTISPQWRGVAVLPDVYNHKLLKFVALRIFSYLMLGCVCFLTLATISSRLARS